MFGGRFKNRSLKFWLLSAMSVIFLVFYFVIVLLTYYEAEDEINEIYDAQLIGTLSSVDTLIQEGQSLNLNTAQSKSLAQKLDLLDYYSPVAIAMISKQGILVSSDEFKRLVVSRQAFLMRHPENRLQLEMDGQVWRVITRTQTHDKQSLLIAGEPMSSRQAAVWEIIQFLSFPVLIGLPLMLFVLSVLINSGFKRLNRFSETFTQSSPEVLAKVPVEAVCPIELKPLVLEVQQLIQRIQKKTEQEKQFTANAAHELKTPIAALKLQLQLLEKQSQAGDNLTISPIKLTLQRTENLIHQLLNLQKIAVESVQFEKVNLNEVLMVVHQTLSPLLEDKQQEVIYQLPDEEVWVRSHAFWCEQLVTNILSNASHYAPQAGRIQVTVSKVDSAVLLQIEDSGSGLSPEEINKVTERFYRLDRHRGQPNGSGLGLSIVKEICQKYQINLTLQRSPTLGGLQVTLRFLVEPII